MTEVSTTARFEAALAALGEQTFVLRLYVAGASPSSRRAIANLSALVDTHLTGRSSVEVIDLYQQPDLAAGEQILAAPTLVRLEPRPVVRIVGDLSDHTKVLAGLDVWPADG